MKKTLIFSDIHLKPAEQDRPRREAFAAFLRGISPEEFDRVICLGDLFDFWFEYRHVVFSAYFDVLRAFAGLREAGIEMHLVCGNHDFWAGRFLREELGIQVHQDTVHLPFGERTGLLLHGDGINAKDLFYRWYKPIARHGLAIGAFRLLHPDWAMGIARAVSKSSRTMFGTDNPDEGREAKALRKYAQGLIAAGTEELVLYGHAHAPGIETHPGPNGEGTYVNPGDWVHHRSHVIWDGTAFTLHGVRNGNQSSAGG